jgi:hypothetical protein
MSHHLCLGPKLELSFSKYNQIVWFVNYFYQNIEFDLHMENIWVLNF